MSPEYVLPMSPEYSVTYVPGRFVDSGSQHESGLS